MIRFFIKLLHTMLITGKNITIDLKVKTLNSYYICLGQNTRNMDSYLSQLFTPNFILYQDTIYLHTR